MVFFTRWFGVTESDADRNPAREKADIEAIVEKSLLMQASAASKQHRSLCRGTHASGVCVRAQFEIFDVTEKRTPELASRLAKGIFAKLGVYPSVVRFANADPSMICGSPCSEGYGAGLLSLDMACWLTCRDADNEGHLT
jgi:hypothetical protein